jgi:hypothetical protein
MARLRERIERDLAWLAHQDVETFHLYAFGTCRQCGANAELAASFADWLQLNDRSASEAAQEGLKVVADSFRMVASSAKALQFSLARASRGRRVDLDGLFGEMSRAYQTAIDGLVGRYGG